MRIEIAGALGVGKSTISSALANHGYHIVYENVTGNPYIELQRTDPEQYAFLCQKCFIDDKIADVESALSAKHSLIATDFSLIAELGYIDNYDAIGPQRSLLINRVENWYAEQGVPDSIVHIYCSPEVQLERIRRRGRSFEHSYDVDSIKRIAEAIKRRIDIADRRGWPVLQVDTTNLPNDGRLPKKVLDLISESSEVV